MRFVYFLCPGSASPWSRCSVSRCWCSSPCGCCSDPSPTPPPRRTSPRGTASTSRLSRRFSSGWGVLSGDFGVSLVDQSDMLHPVPAAPAGNGRTRLRQPLRRGRARRFARGARRDRHRKRQAGHGRPPARRLRHQRARGRDRHRPDLHLFVLVARPARRRLCAVLAGPVRQHPGNDAADSFPGHPDHVAWEWETRLQSS